MRSPASPQRRLTQAPKARNMKAQAEGLGNQRQKNLSPEGAAQLHSVACISHLAFNLRFRHELTHHVSRPLSDFRIRKNCPEGGGYKEAVLERL